MSGQGLERDLWSSSPAALNGPGGDPGSAIVVVRSLWKGSSGDEDIREGFVESVRRLSNLKDPNLAQVIGLCSQDEPICLLSEYSTYGDLAQFLKSHFRPHKGNMGSSSARTTARSGSSEATKVGINPLKCGIGSSTGGNDSENEPGDESHYSKLISDDEDEDAQETQDLLTLSNNDSVSVPSLMFMATQIASGMKYLESQGVVHRDLAARNCLIGKSYQIKISDFAIFRSEYRSRDYRMVASSASRALPLTASNPALSEASEAMEGEGELLPLRWIPWEVHVMGSWSSQSDVWSFGVTLWEIFTHCQSPPLANLADSQIEENLLHHYHANGFHLLPSIPTGCHKDVVTILNECWQRDPQERPRFSEICTVLKNISPTLKSLPF